MGRLGRGDTSYSRGRRWGRWWEWRRWGWGWWWRGSRCGWSLWPDSSPSDSRQWRWWGRPVLDSRNTPSRYDRDDTHVLLSDYLLHQLVPTRQQTLSCWGHLHQECQEDGRDVCCQAGPHVVCDVKDLSYQRADKAQSDVSGTNRLAGYLQLICTIIKPGTRQKNSNLMPL